MSDDRMQVSVLVVDDEIENLDVFRRVFRKHLSLKLANSGLEALRMLDAESFDAVLVDYAMPEMNGIELLQQISARYEYVARIMLTAHIGVAAVMQTKHTGLSQAVLSKPWDRDQVLAVIRDLKQLNSMRSIVAKAG
jgi:CheY-like chemotaxis protein